LPLPRFHTQMCIRWIHFAVMKDVGLRIRVQRELRDSFVAACRMQDKPAAQVLRDFMRAYVAQTEREGERAVQPAPPLGDNHLK
jgi:hypothetical protein